VLLLEWSPTKKKREINEHVEGQPWNVGAIYLFLELYKEKYFHLYWEI
jgi:hypothetical protein